MYIQVSNYLLLVFIPKACCQLEKKIHCSMVRHCLSRSRLLFPSVRLFSGLSLINQFFNNSVFRLPLLNLPSGSWRLWDVNQRFHSAVSLNSRRHLHCVRTDCAPISFAVERCMSVMQSGTQMIKLKRGTKGLVRLFYLDEHRTRLRWRPSRKSEKAKSKTSFWILDLTQ